MVWLQRSMTVTSFIHMAATAAALGMSTMLPPRTRGLLLLSNPGPWHPHPVPLPGGEGFLGALGRGRYDSQK